ncbi:MAG: WD40 repeat domain-containing protein, partial [Deltaproteobacteria bacterium]|nr:WD40 repeat domain-containing protein [Deltaproteobacteria bacterium]
MNHLKKVIMLTSLLAVLWVVPALGEAGWTGMPSPTSKILRGVWGSSGTDVFAVGDDGVILHYNGSGWDMSSRSLYQFSGVWGSSGTGVLAVGTMLSSGTVLRYDGSTWSKMTSWGYPLSSIWGSSATDIFAGGFNTILHYNGSNWTNMYDSSQSNDYFLSVWGSSGTDVFAAGARSVQHYNGTAWTAMSIPTSNTLRGLWGSSG